MNEVLRTIARRHSCRAYDGRLPEKALLDAIALAAVQAPSSRNLQPWRIHVLTDKALLEEMDIALGNLLKKADQALYTKYVERGNSAFYNAPCMFLVLKQADRDLDCGIVTQNITLAAESLGLNSVICGMSQIMFSAPEGVEYRRRAGITEEWTFGVSILVGYGTDSAAPHVPDMSKIQFMD